MTWLHFRNRLWNVYVATRYAWRYGVEDNSGWPVFPRPSSHECNYDRVLFSGGLSCTICDKVQPVHHGAWHHVGNGEWFFLCDDECTADEMDPWPQSYHDGPPGCPVEGCGDERPHHHRDTLDGEEKVYVVGAERTDHE